CITRIQTRDDKYVFIYFRSKLPELLIISPPPAAEISPERECKYQFREQNVKIDDQDKIDQNIEKHKNELHRLRCELPQEIPRNRGKSGEENSTSWDI